MVKLQRKIQVKYYRASNKSHRASVVQSSDGVTSTLCYHHLKGKKDSKTKLGYTFLSRKVQSTPPYFFVDQIYVDDIIFASSKPELCKEFEHTMKSQFQMSMMGELTFFLGLQV
ncbi:hypothetical protein OSB04_024204 [Centaurea solstitialis]|uniref:Reverse transcriptase Ty1/copia-type domain-containing protein n=1 Tax=Centaurea solstitialis TaxID=347529 RepID=A0AA38T449_9ASTR|nr:hypothetical protein OSB04_024204 [Centaurea solstitialis]